MAFYAYSDVFDMSDDLRWAQATIVLLLGKSQLFCLPKISVESVALVRDRPTPVGEMLSSSFAFTVVTVVLMETNNTG